MARSKQQDRRRKEAAARHRPSAAAVPGWYWLGSGLALGLFLAFLYYLATIPPTVTSPAGEAGIPTGTSAGDGLKFSFFTQLPQRRAEAPAHPPAPTAAPPAQQNTIDTATKAGVQYYLQAGSFRQREQAEKRRVQLLLLDTTAEIVQVDRNGQSWYRLQAGPFSSSSQVASIRGKLHDEGIDTLLNSRTRD